MKYRFAIYKGMIVVVGLGIVIRKLKKGDKTVLKEIRQGQYKRRNKKISS